MRSQTERKQEKKNGSSERATGKEHKLNGNRKKKKMKKMKWIVDGVWATCVSWKIKW